jgi:hypothetical protein
MTALAFRDLQPKRSWLFWLGTSSAAAVISAALNAYAVQWLMPHGPAQILGIGASVVLDVWKVLTPVLVLHLWQARMRFGAILCALAGLIPFAISFAMAASFSVVTRADAVTQRTKIRKAGKIYALNCSCRNHNSGRSARRALLPSCKPSFRAKRCRHRFGVTRTNVAFSTRIIGNARAATWSRSERNWQRQRHMKRRQTGPPS